MKKKKLNLIQENEKLKGGFSVLSHEKLKKITGGIIVNDTCTNKEYKACRDNLNRSFCTNIHVESCIDTQNAGVCRTIE
ncbi:hypothetical protein [Fluviicola chungangensis]|uniref:Uncharacterized protein n=1 Tax=Fluviicola chungangensis TaxID=2597671 RepID=A0A556N0T4_9FLAO|nr:hypothetical protein [Fluviicola chungangensis]TSJ45638.1 hypothetical protein FO442_07745 [Fluviicola chungangensis]